MDKDRIKGAMDQVKGRVKRQVGEWTGDPKSQTEGGMGEIKGGVEYAWGKMKDSARNLKHDADRQDRDIETDRKRDAA